MKEHLAAMLLRTQTVNPQQLQRMHAVALVFAVLLLHLWGLSSSALWLSPESAGPVHAQALVTRQIEAATPRAAPIPTPTPPKLARSRLTQPAEGGDSTAEAPPATPLQFDDLGNDLAAPVGLPARAASGVDLPPFKRPLLLGADGLTEVSEFKAPGSALLKYKVQGRVKGFDYWASADLLWTQDGTNYEARLEVGAFLLGSRTQTSKGALGSEGLMPTRFGDKTRNELAAHFQRDKGIISFSANTPDVPLFKGAQDRLSVVLQLSSLLAADPERFPLGTMLTFQTVSQREAEIWQFGVEKLELLSLPYGDVNTLKLQRKPRREFDQNIELWFAPSLGYLPVRMRITNANGDQVDQTLNKVEKPGS